jgi:hypothetical protein
MHTILPVARLLGLRATELIVILIVLLVLFSGYGWSASREPGDDRGRFPRKDVQVLVVVGAIVAVGIAILVWQESAR